jgi:nucleoside 2-deoxyribosyltransferase
MPMGFMRVRGRPIFGYSNDGRLFLERVTAFCGGAIRLRPTGEHEDPDGMAIEPFELHDNLMLVGGIAASGRCLIAETNAVTERYTSRPRSNAAPHARRRIHHIPQCAHPRSHSYPRGPYGRSS